MPERLRVQLEALESTEAGKTEQKTMDSESDNIFTYKAGFDWLCQRRCLLHGGMGVAVAADGRGGVWRLGNGLSLETAQALLAAHDENASKNQWLKKDLKRRLSLVEEGGARYVVKEYLHVIRMSMFSPDQRGWLCGNRLVGSVPVLGWYRDHSRGVLVMACAGEQSLSLWKRTYDIGCMVPKYVRAGQLIAMLHQKNIYHADLKPNNFVVVNAHDTSEDIVLIDCDDVRFPSRLPMKRRVKNLAQFFGGMGFAVTAVNDRRRLAEAAKQGYCNQMRMAGFLDESWHRPFNAYVREIYPDSFASYCEMEDVLWRS